MICICITRSQQLASKQSDQNLKAAAADSLVAKSVAEAGAKLSQNTSSQQNATTRLFNEAADSAVSKVCIDLEIANDDLLRQHANAICISCLQPDCNLTSSTGLLAALLPKLALTRYS